MSQITAKIKLLATNAELALLKGTAIAYRDACNYVSDIAWSNEQYSAYKLQIMTYIHVRDAYGLKSQMAISATRTVASKYTPVKRKELEGSVKFKAPTADLVRTRDWSIDTDKHIVSVNTLEGRIKVPYIDRGFEQYMTRDAKFGTAKLVLRKDKAYLHIPVEIETPEPIDNPETYVGIDLGLCKPITVYDGTKTVFMGNGNDIKSKRAKFKEVRRSLQMRGTPSARRRLREIGERENRYVNDVNHVMAKTLVSQYGSSTVFVLEDLSDVRKSLVKVKHNNRYYMVSWAYGDLQAKIDYKALLKGQQVVYIDPRHTSQTCPKCGKVDRNARHRNTHSYKCKTCGYESNDDRIAAMNIRARGMSVLKQRH